MRKLILLAVLAVSTQIFAQEGPGPEPKRGEHMRKMMALSPEEMATLQTKKMTLALDLNASQQEQIQKITDKFVAQIDDVLKEKEKELMEI